MPVSLTCSGCDTGFSVPDTLAGKWIKCKSCGTALQVPAAAPAAAGPRPASRPPARPVKAAAVVDDDDDADDYAPAAGRRPAKAGGSKLPLILAGLGAFLVVGGGLGGYLALSGGGKPEPVAVNPPAAVTPAQPPAAPADDAKPAAQKPPARVEAATPADPPAKKGSGGGGGLVAPLDPGAVKSVPAGGTAPTAPTKTDIDPLTLDRCKQAAVLFECETVSGRRSTGSGWFGLEPNLVLTNAHVIGMIAPGSAKPKKLTIFVEPGTPRQKEIPHNRIEILAVDRKMDLALIRILNEQGLPSPMKTRLSAGLKDLEKLVVLGYPGGYRLAQMNASAKQPAVTVNETKVMTLRRDDDGNLYSVQVSGGMVWGNSGGPVVDADGRVVAVAVRVDLDPRSGNLTNIAYGVPTEFVDGLLAGRIGEIEYGVPYKDGKSVKFPVTVTCLDPLQRLKSVGIACWVGEDSKKSRPAGEAKPAAETGDADYAEVPLKYTWAKDRQVATGELTLPEAAAGRVYWAQPFYGNGVRDRYWLSGNPIKMLGSPVDRGPVDLTARFKFGTQRTLELSNTNDLEEFAEDEGADRSERVLLTTKVKGKEGLLSTKGAATDAAALFRTRFDTLKVDLSRGLQKQEDVLPKHLRKAFADGLKLCEGRALAAPTGEIIRTESDVRGVGPQNGPTYKLMLDTVMDAFQGASVKLPNKTVQPNETWKQTKLGRITVRFFENPNVPGGPKKDKDDPDEGGADRTQAPGRPGQPPKGKAREREYRYQEEITYKYVGTRTRGGVREAVLEVSGVIANAPGVADGNGARGKVKGRASIDLDTGTVLDAEVDREVEVDSSMDGVKKRLSGVNTYKLTRGSASAGSS